MIEEDRITFAGFPLTDDPKRIKAFMQLASLMNRMAKEQKHTLARPVTVENEKYSLRIWLISLGMKGDEYKTARHILLAPLSGNAAFKYEAMQKRWKEKRKATAQSVITDAADSMDEAESGSMEKPSRRTGQRKPWKKSKNVAMCAV